MRDIDITVHTFTNGAAIFVFGGEISAKEIDHFRDWWRTEVSKDKRPVMLQFGNADVAIVDHPNRFGPDYSFDAISHAFGALGEYKEDEEIEAFQRAIEDFYTDHTP